MTEPQRQDDPPVERLLRQWGARQASRDAQPPAMPQLPPGGRTGRLWRWLPLAAAALVLVAAGVVFDQARREREQVGQARDLIAQLDQARQTTATLREVLADLTQQAQEAQDASAAEVEQVIEQWAALNETARATAEKLAERDGQLAQANQLLLRQRDELGQLAKSAQQVQQLEAKLAQAQTSAGQTGQELAAIREELARAGQALERSQARQQQTLDELQQAYLAPAQRAMERGGSAPSRLAVRQRALKDAALADRAEAVAATTANASTRQTVRRVEAILTKLQLVDLGDADDVRDFGRLLAQSGIIKDIDQALSGQEPPSVRTWLWEARLVLAGADHA